MPNFGMLPYSAVLDARTVTAPTTSSTLTLPPASSYRIIVQVGTVSGTSPTLVVALCTSFDGGVTYNEIITTSTLSTSGQGWQLLVRPYLGIGDAATGQATALLGTANLAAATYNNGPIDPRYVQLRYITGGTSVSFAVNVGIISVPQDLSD